MFKKKSLKISIIQTENREFKIKQNIKNLAYLY